MPNHQNSSASIIIADDNMQMHFTIVPELVANGYSFVGAEDIKPEALTNKITSHLMDAIPITLRKGGLAVHLAICFLKAKKLIENTPDLRAVFLDMKFTGHGLDTKFYPTGGTQLFDKCFEQVEAGQAAISEFHSISEKPKLFAHMEEKFANMGEKSGQIVWFEHTKSEEALLEFVKNIVQAIAKIEAHVNASFAEAACLFGGSAGSSGLFGNRDGVPTLFGPSMTQKPKGLFLE